MDHPDGVTLTIKITATGELKVEGPVTNKARCYMMLEMARDAIKEYADKQAKSAIVPAPPGAERALNGHRHN